MAEYRKIPLDLISVNENNARIHSKQQIKLLAKSIKEFGFTNPLIVDENNILLAGHGRFRAAKYLRLSEVPCICLAGLSDCQKQAYMIADNKLGERSEWDKKTLNSELTGLLLSGINLEVIGFTKGEIAAITLSGEWLEKHTDEKARRDDIWDMLSYAPSLNKKRSIRFLSAFNWILAQKKKAIQELRRLKDECPDYFVERVASEIFDLVSPVLPGLEGGNNWKVTSPPGKHSRKLHFAAEVAKHLSSDLGIPYESVFSERAFDETSTPRNFYKRESILPRSDIAPSNWLLIDDVATSGNTLEACVNILKTSGVVVSAVLIYEESVN